MLYWNYVIILLSGNLWTLCTVHAQAIVKGNCSLCISGDDYFVEFILILLKIAFIDTTFFVIPFFEVAVKSGFVIFYKSVLIYFQVEWFNQVERFENKHNSCDSS